MTNLEFKEEIQNYAFRILEAAAHLDAQIAEETKRTGKRPERIGWYYATIGMTNGASKHTVRKGVNSKFPIATIISHEDTGYFGAPDMITHKLSNTGSGLHQHVKRVAKMSADVKTIISVLTSEPKFAKEIGELVGMDGRKVGNLLKTAAKAGLVKIATVKNKATNFKPTAAYYI